MRLLSESRLGNDETVNTTERGDGDTVVSRWKGWLRDTVDDID